MSADPLALLLDPLFRLPLAAGLPVAMVLPLVGALLFLRDEWLAALGLAHLAAAGAVLGAALGAPAVAGAALLAGLGGVLKGLARVQGNLIYGVMLLGGWALMVLAAANTPAGEGLGRAMIDGQLYFAGSAELTAALVLAVAAALLLPWLMPRILRARLLPRYETANRLPAWRWHLTTDLLVAAALAVGTATLGVMGAFALVLAPAWIGFRLAPSWRATLLIAALTGLALYLAAFVSALLLDQPFGPVLVAWTIAGMGLAALPARLRGAARTVHGQPR